MRALPAVVLIGLSLGPLGAWASCLPYSGVKELSGTLVAKTFPGPPNYESIEAGDKPEKYWLLKLEHPIWVADDPSDQLNHGAADLEEIQLILSRDEFRRYKHLLGKPIKLSGSFMSAISGHHKTPVLLENVTIVAAVG
jgi:hypothetical protein